MSVYLPERILLRRSHTNFPTQVRTLELGSNISSEGKSRQHTLGLMATFVGARQRDAFLNSPERAAFTTFAEAFAEECFVFDFESGAL